jgi:hypothetical protein
MDAASCTPMPLRTTRRLPSWKAPEQVTIWQQQQQAAASSRCWWQQQQQ